MFFMIKCFNFNLVVFDLGWHTEGLMLFDGQGLLSKLVIYIHVVPLETQVMPISPMPHNVFDSVASQGGRGFSKHVAVIIQNGA